MFQTACLMTISYDESFFYDFPSAFTHKDTVFFQKFVLMIVQILQKKCLFQNLDKLYKQ